MDLNAVCLYHLHTLEGTAAAGFLKSHANHGT